MEEQKEIVTPWKRENEDTPLDFDEDGIVVPGIDGTWHVVANSLEFGPELFLLEEDNEGDNWPLTIVDRWGNLILENSYNGFGDLREAIDNDEILIIKQENCVVDTWKIYRDISLLP